MKTNFGTTLKDIAEKAGCSVSAASIVLNNSTGTTGVAPEMRQTILQVAKKLNYRPNLAARSIRMQRSHQVAVVVQNRPGDRYAHPLAFEFILGINESLDAGDFIMSMIRITDLSKGASPASQALKGHLLEGVIVVNPLPRDFEKRIEKMVPSVIWADNNNFQRERCIRRDEVAAGRMAAQAILERGYRDILYVNRFTMRTKEDNVPGYKPGEAHYSVAEREKGILDAIHGKGVQFQKFDLPIYTLDRGAEDVVSCEKELQQWEPMREAFLRFEKELRPDRAVLLYDIFSARSLLHWCAIRGLRPGVDFPIVCCDDDRHGTVIEWPELTRVTFDRYRMGFEAAEMMIQLTKTPGEPCFSRLVAGEWFEGRTLPRLR